MWLGVRSPQVLICRDCDISWVKVGDDHKWCWFCGGPGVVPPTTNEFTSIVNAAGPNRASVGRPMPF